MEGDWSVEDDEVRGSEGGVLFEFRDVVCRAKTFDAVLRVTYDGDPLQQLPFEFSIQARSLSNVTAFRRALQDHYKADDRDWQGLLYAACRKAEAAYKLSAQAIDPFPDDALRGHTDLVEGVFELRRVNMIFGMGETGKSLLTESICVAATNAAEWAGRGTATSRTLWLDYENPTEQDFAERREGLELGGLEVWPGSLKWIGAKGIPFGELVEVIQREAKRWHSEVLVIDSVAFACSGPAEKSEVATAFFRDLAKLKGLTVILIAHTDKAENDKYPFGSIFWHNGIHGMCWYVKRVEGDQMDVGWYNRKASNRKRQRDFGTRLSFGDDGSIRVMATDIRQINRTTGKGNQGDRILSILGQEPMKASDLAKAMETREEAVRSILSRLKGQVLRLEDGRWALRYAESD